MGIRDTRCETSNETPRPGPTVRGVVHDLTSHFSSFDTPPLLTRRWLVVPIYFWRSNYDPAVQDGAGEAWSKRRPTKQPCRGAGFPLRVVLAQPTGRPRKIAGGGLGGLGGVYVVVDRPPLELGDRQHRSACPRCLRRTGSGEPVVAPAVPQQFSHHCANVPCRNLAEMKRWFQSIYAG